MLAFLRFVGWGILGLLLGELIFLVSEEAIFLAFMLFNAPQAWSSLHHSAAWGAYGWACLAVGVWILWSRMTGRARPPKVT